jgi:hypothetical protein
MMTRDTEWAHEKIARDIEVAHDRRDEQTTDQGRQRRRLP